MSDRHERTLIVRVVDALLREDHLGLASRGRLAGDGSWRVDGLPAGPLRLPVRPDGWLAQHRLSAPWVARGTRRLARLEEVLAALTPAGDPDAEAGWAAFRAECTADLMARRLAASARATVLARAARLPCGLAGALAFEALAAHADHPVYPTSRCRHGLSAAELRSYSPEHAPVFALRWVAVPPGAAAATGPAPTGWPTPAEVGLPDDGGVLLPVHPLTAARWARLADPPPARLGGRLAPRAYLAVTPTLSMRTVAVRDDPELHLKLPLPTATLGARNTRGLRPGTLADGAAMQRILQAVAAGEPRFAGRILHAEETTYAETGEPDLAWLARRYPSGLIGCLVVPVAALTAQLPAGGGSPAGGASPANGGSLAERPGLLDSYLDLLLDWHVALWLRYGVALEAHQQNMHLVAGPGGALRLVYKDNDGARVDLPRLAAALGDRAPFPLTPAAFADQRMLAADPGELADVFTTITLYLCAAAPLRDLADRGVLPGDPAGELRRRLRDALDRWTDPADPGSVAAAALMRARVLEAATLPVKAMVTAGTLLPKARLGCADVNKHYRRTGPNYLLTPGSTR